MKTSRKSFWRFLFRFHRYAGLCAAVFIILLAVTGIALNHTENFKLDSQFIKSPILLDWYGIAPTGIQIAFIINNRWFTQSGEQIYINTQKLLKNSETLVGVVETDDFLILGFPTSLMLISPQGEIIEKIEKPLSKLGIDDTATFIFSNDQILSSKDQLLSWQETDQQPDIWSIPSKPPSDLIQAINDRSRDDILPYERVILDLHSGRFFGQYGVFVVDLVGILSFLLALSGCWIWLRHTLRHRFSRKKR